MVMVTINDQARYYDGYLKENLDIIKQAVELKWDGVIYVGGYEGDGKSVLAGQIALNWDPTYCLERCVFTPEQFIEAVDKAEPGQAIVYDEAQDAFESTNRDAVARLVKSKLTRIRKKRLYIIIVAPDFWRINRYLFIHRSRAFIRVYSDGLTRGFFEFYNRERKHKLMILGRRNEDMSVVTPNFRGRFTNWFPLDEEAYDAKKEAGTQSVKATEQNHPISEKEQKHYALAGAMKLYHFCHRNQWFKRGFNVEMIGKLFGVTKPTLYKHMGLLEETDESTGGPGFEGSKRGSITTPNFLGPRDPPPLNWGDE